MRKIELHPLNTRKWKRWRTDCRKATQALMQSVADGEKPTFNERLYKRKSIKDDYFFSKDTPFYGKCAYCESYIPDFQHGDVEHFRPKGGVTDAEDNPIILKDSNADPVLDENGNPVAHPGYYWLAYDWHNLLPSCVVCNQPNSIAGQKIGKHNRFPVIGDHAQTPDTVSDEQPLLINPASDDPAKHFVIDTTTGILGHRTERGKMSIRIFGLNLRDQLVSDRQRACREVLSLLTKIIYQPTECDAAIAELRDIRDGKRSYTMAARAVFAELEPILTPLFTPA